MQTTERRMELLKILCRRRKDTIKNLSFELGVCERTIRRDIEQLSLKNPIYTLKGKHGGVYIMEDFQMDRMYMGDEEIRVLKKALNKLKNKNALTEDEKKVFEAITTEYAKPKTTEGEKIL